MEKKSFEERYRDEVLTDNAALNHYSQCKDCIFRDKRIVNGEECGWDKCVCRMYGKNTALNNPTFYPYTPVEYKDKPNGVYNNTENCEYYEKEKRKK